MNGSPGSQDPASQFVSIKILRREDALILPPGATRNASLASAAQYWSQNTPHVFAKVKNAQPAFGSGRGDIVKTALFVQRRLRALLSWINEHHNAIELPSL